jgi:hypothetical protein
MRSPALLLGCMALFVPHARAVIIEGGDGTSNLTDPGDIGWSYVGSVNGASGIYLGNYGGSYWALTAAHVGAGNLTIGSNTYTYVANSAVQVRNGDNSTADLTLFQIQVPVDPGLTTLTLATAAPPANAVVTMIGNGVHETGTPSYWAVTDSSGTLSWTSTSQGSANLVSYAYGSGGKRWGETRYIETSSYNIGTGATTALVTIFQPFANYAQAGPQDSGGALFYSNGGTLELAGVLGAVGALDHQPGSTAATGLINSTIYGDVTYAGDISTYRSFILSAIPEPGTTTAWIGTLAACAVVALRRRRA